MIAKDNPKLQQKALADGRISLYLEYYLGRESRKVLNEDGTPALYESGEMAGTPKYKVKHIRKKEVLSLYLVAKPKSPAERQMNKETLELAKRIRFEREQEFIQAKEGYRLKREKKVDFYAFFQKYIDGYTKADLRMVKAALRYFRDFIADSPDYRAFVRLLRPEQIDSIMIRRFADYLRRTHKGEGANTYYQRFKKVVTFGEETGIFEKNPCRGITIPVDRSSVKKDILSQDEIRQLLATHYAGENPNIRRAFTFSLLCGLRYCDVKGLTFANVDFSNRILTFDQAKTKGHSTAAAVTIPLNDTLLKLIGGPGNRQDIIFPLPSHNMCLKALRHWTARAGIEKHITWHCARHSFAVNILINGANIKTVAGLLGHSGLQHTDKYLRTVDKLKEDAINSINIDVEL